MKKTMACNLQKNSFSPQIEFTYPLVLPQSTQRPQRRYIRALRDLCGKTELLPDIRYHQSSIGATHRLAMRWYRHAIMSAMTKLAQKLAQYVEISTR